MVHVFFFMVLVTEDRLVPQRWAGFLAANICSIPMNVPEYERDSSQTFTFDLYRRIA